MTSLGGGFLKLKAEGSPNRINGFVSMTKASLQVRDDLNWRGVGSAKDFA